MTTFENAKVGDRVTSKPTRKNYASFELVETNTKVDTIVKNSKITAVRRYNTIQCLVCKSLQMVRNDVNFEEKICKCMKDKFSEDLKYYDKYSIETLPKHMYQNNIECSTIRGHAKPEYTLAELTDFVLSHKEFSTLYKNWKENGFSKWYKPSIDRLDSTKGYSLDNIQLVNFKENNKNFGEEVKNGLYKTRNQKAVEQLDIGTGKVIAEHISASAAGRTTGFSYKVILKACNSKIKTYKGFGWRFKPEYITQ